MLAVRGTSSFQDVIADAMADEVDFEQILNKKQYRVTMWQILKMVLVTRK